MLRLVSVRIYGDNDLGIARLFEQNIAGYVLVSQSDRSYLLHDHIHWFRVLTLSPICD